MKRMHASFMIPFCIAVLILSAEQTAVAGYLEIYGSPTYNPGMGGYLTSIYGSNPKVNEDGVAVANVDYFDALGVNVEGRVTRWSDSNVQILDVPMGFSTSVATAINDSGSILGWGFTSGFQAPLRWESGSTSALPMQTVAGQGGVARDINAAGEAVGHTNLAQAIRWDSTGVVSPLSTLPGVPNYEGYFISDTGTIYGRAFGLGGDRPVRWSADGQITELGIPGPDVSGYTDVYFVGANASGSAIAYIYKFSDAGEVVYEAPVVWNASGPAAIELAALSESGPFPQNGAAAINAAGEIVGSSQRTPMFPGDFFGQTAVKWSPDGSVVTPLASLAASSINGESNSIALDISDSGLIVGTAVLYDDQGSYLHNHAVAWTLGGEIVDLNSLIAPDSGWLLKRATTVTNSGWVAGLADFDPDGIGGKDAYERYFLLKLPNPVPEPASAILIVAASTISGYMYRRRLSHCN